MADWLTDWQLMAPLLRACSARVLCDGDGGGGSDGTLVDLIMMFVNNYASLWDFFSRWLGSYRPASVVARQRRRCPRRRDYRGRTMSEGFFSGINYHYTLIAVAVCLHSHRLRYCDFTADARRWSERCFNGWNFIIHHNIKWSKSCYTFCSIILKQLIWITQSNNIGIASRDWTCRFACDPRLSITFESKWMTRSNESIFMNVGLLHCTTFS